MNTLTDEEKKNREWSKRKNRKSSTRQKVISDAFENQRRVEIIPAKQDLEKSNKTKPKVAAYCRVSTFEESQSGSFELQKQAYKEKIQQNPDWDFAGIYADEGVSGASISGRICFQQMIEDCRLNKIDLIIVKSISRFSRNLLDFISITRELKALSKPTGVIIEDVNINTLDNKSEFILGIMSLIAQGESEQKSASITWAVIERFKKGIPIIPTHNLLGYSKNRFGIIEIVEDEAEIVRFIYSSFINGITAKEIALNLMKLEVPTVTGNPVWSSSSIYRILRNEKYVGDVLMQKTFTVDCFTHKSKKNNGEKPMYLLKDGIPFIIPREEWELTQELLKNPRKGFKKESGTTIIVNPKNYVSTIKSGVFKGFIIIDIDWSQKKIQEIFDLKGED